MKSVSGYNTTVVRAFFSECGLPDPIAEFQFLPDRKFRFDFCWPNKKVALEVQGGLWSGGAHVRGAALLKEYEKYNMACVLGWRILFVVPQDLCLLETVNLIKQSLDV